MRILAPREYSRAEMTKKLLKAEFSQSTIDDVLSRLVRLKYVDDARLAGQIARFSANRKSFARRRAMMEITRRGISRDLAEPALTEVYSRVNSSQLAKKLADKHAARLSRLDPETARRRLAGLLHRRGFDGDSVQAAIEQFDS
jgi:regulatory protein